MGQSNAAKTAAATEPPIVAPKPPAGHTSHARGRKIGFNERR